MDGNGFGEGFLSMGFITLFLIFGVGRCAENSGKQIIKIQAVENGHAKWVPQPNGETIFEWLPVEKKQ